MKDAKTPWLEPGVGLYADSLAENADTHEVNQHLMIGAALMSLAVTFKRLVDMVEPFAKVAAEQLAQQAASEGKRK